jgi:hypothetical protein
MGHEDASVLVPGTRSWLSAQCLCSNRAASKPMPDVARPV